MSKHKEHQVPTGKHSVKKWLIPVSVILFIFYQLTSVFYFDKSNFSYDEPHYLLGAQSIYCDRDLDLENNYSDKTYTFYYAGQLDPHVSPNSKDGWFSIHGYGLSYILVPSFWITDKLLVLAKKDFSVCMTSKRDLLLQSDASADYLLKISVSVTLSTFMVLSFIFLVLTLLEIESSEEVWKKSSCPSWPILLGLFCVNPILIYTKFISVELLAFLYISFIAWTISRRSFDWVHWLLAPVWSGLLLFVHIKFLVITASALLSILLVYRKEIGLKKLTVGFLVFVSCVAYLCIANKQMYNSYALNAQYSEGALSGKYLFQGILGQFLDGHTGLFFSAPIFSLLIVYGLSWRASALTKRYVNFFFIVGVPTIVLASLHVLKQSNLFMAGKFDFINSLFTEASTVPMWFQTPISRFIFPIISIFALLLSGVLSKEINKGTASRLIIGGLFLTTLAISFVQLFSLPHTLFRPNANFEGFAPHYTFISEPLVHFIPNLLSFNYVLENLLLTFVWIFVLSFFHYLNVKNNIGALGSVLAVGFLSLLVSTRIAEHNHDLKIDPMRMQSNLAWSGNHELRVFSTDVSRSTDILFGPYVYISSGRFCAKVQSSIRGSYTKLKWYVADGITGKLYIMDEITRPLDSQEFNPVLCFNNETPYYPKEFKVYAENFNGQFLLKGIEFKREDD
ncbi:hypothetical protein RAE21_06025 [Rhodoferax sp. TBRC 17198]|uniref:hypothetical protein n=1 Tax=Rhodoferax potami TaxID=3068338 RepID=UPI0028BD2667|nr:hypothetical protein [Rhodoferax sp. TBRC 17198]MDT7521968.1 hypothetical protein [Rhodoferax sp. TBRC 17198]